MTHPATARLLAAIAARSLSVRGVCADAGLGPNYLAGLKRTGFPPSPDALVALWAVLGVSEEEIDMIVMPPDAPAPEAEPAPGLSLMLLPLSAIFAGALNPRKSFDAEALGELAESIRVQGLLQNLVVRPGLGGMYELVAGERRYRALTLLADRGHWDAKAPNIPCRVVGATDSEALALALLENLQRVDVPPLDEAAAFARLRELDPDRWTTAAIGVAIGKTQRFVQQRLALASGLTEPARAALAAGKMTVEQARVVATLPAERQKTILKELPYHQTAAQTRQAATRQWVPLARAIFGVAPDDPDVAIDDEGARWLPDRDRFKARQKAALPGYLAALGERFQHVALVDGHLHPDDMVPADGHCLVQHDYYTGEVTVHEHLRAPEQEEEEARESDADRVWKIRRAANEERRYIARDFYETLAQSLDYADSLRLPLLRLIHAGSYDKPPPLLMPSAHRSLYAEGGPLAAFARYADGDRVKSNVDQLALWRLMEATGYHDLRKALQIVVGQAIIEAGCYTTDGVHPVLMALASEYDIAPPPELLWSEADYEAEIARRAGLPAPDPAQPDPAQPDAAQLELEEAIDHAAE